MLCGFKLSKNKLPLLNPAKVNRIGFKMVNACLTKQQNASNVCLFFLLRNKSEIHSQIRIQHRANKQRILFYQHCDNKVGRLYQSLGVGPAVSQVGAILVIAWMYFFIASSLEIFPRDFQASNLALSTILSLEG